MESKDRNQMAMLKSPVPKLKSSSPPKLTCCPGSILSPSDVDTNCDTEYHPDSVTVMEHVSAPVDQLHWVPVDSKMSGSVMTTVSPTLRMLMESTQLPSSSVAVGS